MIILFPRKKDSRDKAINQSNKKTDQFFRKFSILLWK